MREFVEDAAHLVAAHGGSMSGEHGDGRARGELLPDHVLAGGHWRPSRRSRHIFDPEQPAQSRRNRPTRAGLTPTYGCQPARPLRDLAFAYPHDGGDLMAAVHRCVGVGKCRADFTARWGRHVPVLSRHPRREGLHPRAGLGCCRRLANGTPGRRLAGARSGRGARPMPVLQGLRVRLPGRDRHGDLQVRGPVPALPAPPASTVALRAGLATPVGRIASRAPRLANAVAPRPRSGLAKRVAGVDGRRPLPRFARRTFRQWFAGHPPADGDPVVLLVDTFTDHFTPAGRAGGRPAARGTPAIRCRLPGRPCAVA